MMCKKIVYSFFIFVLLNVSHQSAQAKDPKPLRTMPALKTQKLFTCGSGGAMYRALNVSMGCRYIAPDTRITIGMTSLIFGILKTDESSILVKTGDTITQVKVGESINPYGWVLLDVEEIADSADGSMDMRAVILNGSRKMYLYSGDTF
jgi:hypothetical protein